MLDFQITRIGFEFFSAKYRSLQNGLIRIFKRKNLELLDFRSLRLPETNTYYRNFPPIY